MYVGARFMQLEGRPNQTFVRFSACVIECTTRTCYDAEVLCAENMREMGNLDSRPFVAHAICPAIIEYVGQLLGVFHARNDLTREVGYFLTDV